MAIRHGHATLTDELRRKRLLDMEARLGRFRLPTFAVLAASLVASGPWIGWLWLAALVPAMGAPLVCQRRMPGSRRPELWAAAGWAISPLMIAACVALTGATDSPAIPWFALAAVTLGARFERHGVSRGLFYMIALMLLSTAAVDPHGAAASPQSLIFPAGLTFAVTIFSAAVVQSDRHHRLEAAVDPLTGLLNRTALHQRFAELRQQAGKGPSHASVGFLVVDLDDFKRVNDEHGHVVGDTVLREHASVMRASLRAFDLVFRMGGEEFVVLLPGADLAKTAEIAERLRTAAEDARPAGLPVTLSVGAAVATGRGFDFDELYRRADKGLYLAKQSGRNCVRVWAGEGDYDLGLAPAQDRQEPRMTTYRPAAGELPAG